MPIASRLKMPTPLPAGAYQLRVAVNGLLQYQLDRRSNDAGHLLFVWLEH
jgi:hypothetical protein